MVAACDDWSVLVAIELEPPDVGGGDRTAPHFVISRHAQTSQGNPCVRTQTYTNKFGEILPCQTFENEFGPSRPLSDFMSPEQLVKFNAETARLRREMEREIHPVRGDKRS